MLQVWGLGKPAPYGSLPAMSEPDKTLTHEQYRALVNMVQIAYFVTKDAWERMDAEMVLQGRSPKARSDFMEDWMDGAGMVGFHAKNAKRLLNLLDEDILRRGMPGMETFAHMDRYIRSTRAYIEAAEAQGRGSGTE